MSFIVSFPNMYGFPGFHIGICEENVNTAGLVANSFMSIREPGNMIDSWTIPGNVALWMILC